MMEINVLMTTDENYLSQARVAIWSARKYTDADTKLIFTVLCSKCLDRESRKRLLVLEDEWENLVISFFEVEERDFSETHGVGHISIAAYYRLLAAKILSVDKCIYLDCDLVVSLDLNDLYNIDISGFYVGGVLDMALISQPNLAFKHMQSQEIEDFSDYINSGVLLMNLDLIRKEHLTEKFLVNMVQSNSPWIDQDVINKVCHGRICLLDWSFNHIAGYSNEDYIWQYGRSEREGMGEIFHWAGLNKAWHNYSFWQAELWWKIAEEALEPDIYQEYYVIADISVKQTFFSEIGKQCIDKKEIVIAGYSDHGMQVMRYLRRYGVSGKIVFCDNNRLKGKMDFIGCCVLSMEEAADKYKNAVWINAIQNERDNVNIQLKQLGISLTQIIEYYAVNSEYYFNLSMEYMRRGLEEKIYLQQNG